MTHYQRAAWLAALLVTLVAFGLLVPRLPALGAESIMLSSDTEVGLATASVTIPAGWELEIEATSQRTPVALRDGVEVTVSDAVWLGDSDDLLAHVSQLMFDGEARLPHTSDTADDSDDSEDSKDSRELWHLEPNEAAAAGAPVRVDVIRDGEGVVLVIARGTEREVSAQSDAIDAILDSVHLELSELNVEAGT